MGIADTRKLRVTIWLGLWRTLIAHRAVRTLGMKVRTLGTGKLAELSISRCYI